MPKHSNKHPEDTRAHARRAETAEEEVHDPMGTGKEPMVRTGTLPVEAKSPEGEPVGHARHAETPEEREKIEAFEHSKIPPPGSRNYVAGQPVNEKEYQQTQDEAARLAAAGKAQRTEAEQRAHENNPMDPEYNPARAEEQQRG